MPATIRRFAVVGVLLLAAVSIQSAAFRHKRDVGDSPDFDQKECHKSTPCGWAVYTPFTRRVDYFMRNTCVCPKTKVCLRADDDLSISAYVYRCQTETTTAGQDVA